MPDSQHMSSPRNVSVLMVDDRAENLLAMEVVLEQLGADLVKAKSGKEALAHIDEREFAVILLDVQMPGFDGFQTAFQIRSKSRGAQTPIIFLTAHSTDETALMRGYAEGAVDYVVKPFRPEVLRTKVKVFLELYKRIEDCRRMGSELRRLNQQLERRVESRTSELTKVLHDSRRASEAKSVFLASMSHELRTPLNSILGFAELLEEQLIDSPQTEAARDAQKLREAGEHLLKLVNDLLDLARIEAGRIEFNIEEFEAATILAEIADMIRPIADQQGTKIEVICSAQNHKLRADRQKLRQILINLAANAVKFTKNGTVTLSCKWLAGTEPRQMRFGVEDTGPGLSPGQIARLFGEYEQGEPPPGDPVEGTGLGLAISRQLCLAMGGTLTADSEPDKGAVFEFTIPSDPPNGDAAD